MVGWDWWVGGVPAVVVFGGREYLIFAEVRWDGGFGIGGMGWRK